MDQTIRKGGGLCFENELDFNPFSSATTSHQARSKAAITSRDFALQALQEANRAAVLLARCADQRNGVITHEIKQILATCEGQLSVLLARLRDIKEKLERADRRSEVIEQLLSSPVPESDEFGSLVKSIIQLSFEGAQHKNADAARDKLIANSVRQAQQLAPVIAELRDSGAKSLQELADGLNGRDLRTKNGHIWYSSTVRLLLQKIDQLEKKTLSV